MSLKAYIALHVESLHPQLHNKHLTCAFMPAGPTRYLHISSIADLLPTKAIIKGIDYWPAAGVTVALVALTPALEKLKLSLVAAGWTYLDHEWTPYVTVWYGRDNRSDKFQHLIGAEVTFTDAYIRMKEFN